MRLPGRRPWAAVRRVSPLLLLPLSAIPLLGAVPLVMATYDKYVRYYSSPPLAAPRNPLSEAEQEKFKPLPDYPVAIPVLVYHGINDDVDGYSVSQQRFAAQMQMLKIAGFHTVSIAQYARFQQGDLTGLPPGRFSSRSTTAGWTHSAAPTRYSPSTGSGRPCSSSRAGSPIATQII